MKGAKEQDFQGLAVDGQGERAPAVIWAKSFQFS